MSRPSIRVRVRNLFRGGHYDPKTIECRNVETKSDGTPCIMLMCKCLSSKSSVMHQVTAVFEDEPNGKYRVEESNCSCMKGEHFCSHSIGFLYLLSVVQKLTSMDPPQTQEQFEDHYRVNPKCVQSSLMLIENIALVEKFLQSKSQRAKKKRKTSA